MIASLTGIVAEKINGQLIIDVGGVGYLVTTSPQLQASLVIGENAKLRTAFIVREDGFLMYGFSNSAELELFEILRSVSGVGPKLAMAIFSELGIDRISQAVTSQDDKVFHSVSGIGPKTAKLLTVALEGKVRVGNLTEVRETNSAVLSGLVGLGWPEKQAIFAIQEVSKKLPSDSTEKELLRASLSLLASEKPNGVMR